MKVVTSVNSTIVNSLFGPLMKEWWCRVVILQFQLQLYPRHWLVTMLANRNCLITTTDHVSSYQRHITDRDFNCFVDMPLVRRSTGLSNEGVNDQMAEGKFFRISTTHWCTKVLEWQPLCIQWNSLNRISF